MKRLGLDIGSTTIKCVVLDEECNIVYSSYDRHMSRIAQMSKDVIKKISEQFPWEEMSVTISGSAGMGLATHLGVSFEQEVYATRIAVKKIAPMADVVIELGGEDAKILFLTDGFEARMNGTCAGGTGAFIDQMATLIKVTPDELNELAKKATKHYTIASRCGVFAKSDIQPLLNQGAQIADVADSILRAVVNQTIGGLAQGREIKGNVLYLGGPLTFLSALRHNFDEALGLTGNCPENSKFFVAYGAALLGKENGFLLNELAKSIDEYCASNNYLSSDPLFCDEKQYEEFVKRHESNSAHIKYIDDINQPLYLGIDAGSTTVKAIICNRQGDILDKMYQSNNGNPVPIIRDYIAKIYKKYPGIKFSASAVTGYGEDIIKNAFGVDIGIVETIAHFTAAKKFKPDVDFIIDIGGQDIKCFKIRNNAIDNIFLNEACSSGCGSFLQTFAHALGREIDDFGRIGLFANRPVDLGSRCTVFMNSQVKQAQKDGATIENISAGLSMSVVKNALYKVIRCASANDLGENIVVQGGTFLNDAVLRSFEKELNTQVIRPVISGVMGAYGAALFAASKVEDNHVSSLISQKQLENFTHEVSVINCKGCNNHCQLTVNSFGDDKKFIAGNKCDKPLLKKTGKVRYNIFEYKDKLLSKYRTNEIKEARLTIGIPMALNMFELLPFWYKMFTELGFNVVVSKDSTRMMFIDGQSTVPSDTICYPAKLVHGHIEELVRQKVDAIFYPCMTYNFDEQKGDNHYNCPVVAYYPKVIDKNVHSLGEIKFIHDFIGIHNKKEFPKKFAKLLKTHFNMKFDLSLVKLVANQAYDEYEHYMNKIKLKGHSFLEAAKKENRPVIVIAGRPYHLDKEVNHGLDRLICDLGAVVISEDSVAADVSRFRNTVLNQWTYHSRVYLAAKFVAESNKEDNINLVQFVSFGCGVDAITTDETRSILEAAGKIYTQLKIDEVTNTGAAKIRIRSLFAAACVEL